MSLNGLALQYLSDLLGHMPDCGTRIDHKNLLVNPQVRTVTFGGSTFMKDAPDLWNNIPNSLHLSANVK